LKSIVHEDFFKSLKRLCRSKWHPSNLWYRFKCWAWKRYTTIKPRNLDHTWCDRCELLPHMMFEILGEFIEKECSPGHVEWYGEHGHKIEVDGEEVYVMDEMKALWEWFTEKYMKAYPEAEEMIYDRIRAIDEQHLKAHFVPYGDSDDLVEWDPQYDDASKKEFVSKLYSECSEREQLVEEEKAEMMHRLVNIHRYMWT